MTKYNNHYLYDEFISNLLDLAIKDIKPYRECLKELKNLRLFEVRSDDETFLTIRFALFGVTKINVYITTDKMTFVNLTTDETYNYNLNKYSKEDIVFLENIIIKHFMKSNEWFYDELMSRKYNISSNDNPLLKYTTKIDSEDLKPLSQKRI